ncbi:protein translocase subunit SecF [Candidatus Margulisiibacteriota bacterium]
MKLGTIDIIGKTRLWFIVSAIFIFVGLFGLISNGMFKGSPMNFGIDFTGGTTLNLRFQELVSLEEVREILGKYNRANAVIQRSGGYDLIIKTEPLPTKEREDIVNDIKEKFSGTVLLEADTIGPVIGAELRRQAFWALMIAMIGILIYVAFRFEFKYAVAAIIALLHDAIITVGLIAILWRPVDTPFIAAILTVLGYSINDTIVIFDRIRENLSKAGAAKRPLSDVVNESVNQTFARSINTVLTVLFMNAALLLFGGATIKNFALTLFIGFTAGAYSSIFVASPVLVLLTKWGKKG